MPTVFFITAWMQLPGVSPPRQWRAGSTLPSSGVVAVVAGVPEATRAGITCKSDAMGSRYAPVRQPYFTDGAAASLLGRRGRQPCLYAPLGVGTARRLRANRTSTIAAAGRDGRQFLQCRRTLQSRRGSRQRDRGAVDLAFRWQDRRARLARARRARGLKGAITASDTHYAANRYT